MAFEWACVLLVKIVVVGCGLYGVGQLGLTVALDLARLRMNAQAGAAAAQYLEAAIKAGVLPAGNALVPSPPPGKK